MDVEKGIDAHTLALSAADASARAGIRIADAHAAGTITLSDAALGNIPGLETYRDLGPALSRWGRAAITYCVVMRSTLPDAFAVGYGRVFASTDTRSAREQLREAYALTWALDCFTKPMVPLIDGPVSGAGAGLSLYGTHCVAGEGYRFSMPGPSIGWFPDHGTAHVFSRMPDGIGVYLALTGTTIGRADAFRLRLLTECIGSEHFDHIARSLSDADPIDPLLDDLHSDEGESELEPTREAIAHCFAVGTIDEILDRLRQVKGVNAAWADAVVVRLLAAPRPALDISLRLLGMARALDLRDTLILDYRVASRLLALRSGEAASIATDETSLARVFAPLEDGDLPLLTRAEMQAVGP